MIKNIKIMILFFQFLYTFVYSQNGINILKPGIEGKTCFAIFCDKETYNKTGTTIKEYKESIEKTGLPSYIISAEWKSPEDIKQQIIMLFNQPQKLEGIVLIGDIPIVMLRDAQHFSSAFKMDQNRYPFIRSSIPSDRFYDDFDLKFKFLKKDSLNQLINYYSLLSSSPSLIEKEIYSSRIKPTANGEAKYKQIENYLKKAVRIKNENNKLNKILFGTGDGYVSDSHDAYISEVNKFAEYFPLTKEYDGQFIKTFCKTNHRMKDEFLNYLKNEDLDLTILTAHGEPNYAYINWIKPKDTSKAEKDKSFKLGHILIEDIKNQKINTRVMICNSCFNGAFIEKEYLAGEYIFSEGNCITSCANSVNVLQDIWVLEDGGLIASGARIGQWHKNISYLESHLFGDPTFSFTPEIEDKDLSVILDITDKIPSENLKSIAMTSAASSIKSKALDLLYKNEGPSISEFLLEKYKKETSAEVRTKIIKILARIKDKTFEEVLLLGLNDPSEFIRRVSVKILGETGKEELIPILAKYFVNDPSERVTSSAETSLNRINSKKSQDYVFGVMKENPDITSDSILVIKTKIGFKSKMRMAAETDSILKTNNQKKKISEIRSLRGNRTNAATNQLLKIIADNSEPIPVRVAAAEAIGWYGYQYDWNSIAIKLDEILKDQLLTEEIRDNIITARKRLISGPNNPLTP